MLFIILVGRFIGTVGLVSLLTLFKHKPKTSFKELVFIWYAGLIRGAIAFGLVLRIDKSIPNRGVIVTTSLSLVVFTTVVFGCTVATLNRVLFGGEKDKKEVRPYLSIR